MYNLSCKWDLLKLLAATLSSCFLSWFFPSSLCSSFWSFLSPSLLSYCVAQNSWICVFETESCDGVYNPQWRISGHVSEQFLPLLGSSIRTTMLGKRLTVKSRLRRARWETTPAKDPVDAKMILPPCSQASIPAVQVYGLPWLFVPQLPCQDPPVAQQLGVPFFNLPHCLHSEKKVFG